MPLLYVDVLGMKARWQSANLVAVRSAYETFETLLGSALDTLPSDAYFEAGVQSDAAAVLFADVGYAVEAGRAMFCDALNRSTEQERFWMRGVIVEAPAQFDSLEMNSDKARNGGRFKTRHFSDALLGAVLAEQTGPRGARLLVRQSLVTQRLRNRFAIRLDTGKYMVPFKRLANSVYPRNDGDAFADVLWMLPTRFSGPSWEAQHRVMDNALRWAGKSASTTRRDDEFAHAAATELVFKECNAILGDIKRRRSPTRKR